jgi:Xaa-Pro dipeptidase
MRSRADCDSLKEATMSTRQHPRQVPRLFSTQEQERRRAALDDAMAAADVQHLVVYGAQRSGSAVQWLTGWPVTREAAVVHTPGEPDLLLVEFFNHVPQATLVAATAEVRWVGPSTTTSVLEELRQRRAPATGRVGVIGGVPFQMHAAMRQQLGDVVDLSPAYTRLRLEKSPEEIEWIRRAARLTDLSCEALLTGAAPGTSEHQLNALVEGAYVAHGGGHYIHYFSFTSMADPDQCVPSQWPSERTLAAGDAMSCELSASYGVDYPGQLLRTFTVGADPTPLYQELHEVADEALTRIEATLAPGVTAEEIVAAADVIEEAGFTTVDDLVHGLGGGYLPPVIGSRSRTLQPLPTIPLSAGMTVVVQPNVSTPDRRAGVQTGDLLLVTETGCERLHAFPRGLHRIG